jgi:HK97 family phage prohead protease
VYYQTPFYEIKAFKMPSHPSTTVEGYFSGYASIFDTVDAHKDQLIRGAFQETLSQWDQNGEMPKMLWQHDPHEPIGYWTHIEEDHRGLYVEGQLLLDLQRGREAYVLLKAGVLKGLSIGFRIKNAIKPKSTSLRLITNVDLLEISLVTWGANKEALVQQVKTKPIPF